MQTFQNADGRSVVEAMITAIQENKVYLSEVDGLIGDGDHGTNMNKGFTLCQRRMQGRALGFTDALGELGAVLFNEIGGSMGPIYGTIFTAMAQVGEGLETIDARAFCAMLDQAVTDLQQIIQAQVGDKTLMDALCPARGALGQAVQEGLPFSVALVRMAAAAEAGKESTLDLVAKFGRSSRLGERSRGVLDAGAVSCWILLAAMASGIVQLLQKEAAQ